MEDLYTKGSEWRKWDLQVQTILDDNYTELSSYYQKLKDDYPAKWDAFITKVGSESEALQYDSKGYFYTDATTPDKTRADKYATTFLSFLESFHDDCCCIAITDHNYGHSYLLDSFLKASNKSHIKVICGVEINVQGVHVLALFDSNLYAKANFSEGLNTFLTKINVVNKKENGTLTVSDKSYTDVIDEITNNDGLIVYPHCGSSNGLFQEKGKTDRTHLAAHFNYQEFNILQGKNVEGCNKTESYIESNNNLTSGYCFTLASDSRSLQDVLSADKDGNYTWIKTDPTFEGLKQITFEPESRVMIQANKPEDKPGYQVIDRITFNSPLVFNDEIQLNPNLNSIVGGRSTGKSVLLTAIAKKLKTTRPAIPTNKIEYNKFVAGISNDLNVYWKDGEVNNDREIEFFQQGYMYDLATNKKRLSDLIQDILKLKGKSYLIQLFSSKKADTKKSISSFINDLFQVLKDIKEKNGQKLEKGDHKGIQDEITRLEKELNSLDSASFSEDERQSYEAHKNIIETSYQKKEVIQKDKEQLLYLNEISIFRDGIEYETTSISEDSRTLVNKLFNKLQSEADKKWKQGIQEVIESLNEADNKENNIIEASKNNKDYVKVSAAYKNSTQLSELEEKLSIQRQKLFEITSIIEELKELSKQKGTLVTKIIDSHKSYYTEISKLCPQLSDKQDGLEINAHTTFSEEKYCDILQSALNLQSYSNQIISSFSYKDDEQYTKHITKIFDDIITRKITLKGGYTYQSLTSSLLSECFYSLSYDLVYEGDNFNQMSDGKKAFVVLKLLLDFSDKNCPILIDQPEDDLDNRAIYLDLVQYIKQKKILRQIIVATHNPNIVVVADSELVIVANQHGVNNENHDNKKFEYKSGSLENTMRFNKSCQYTLDSQGIREHVCVILEGGDAAFKLREKKYAI